MRREHHHGQATPLAEPTAHLNAVDVRQHQVKNHQIERLDSQRIEGGLTGAHLDHVIAVGTQDQSQGPPNLRLVVDNQHPGMAHRHTAPLRTGSVKTKRAPAPGASSSHSLPPCASTNPRAMVRPNPEPGARVCPRSKGRNSRSRSARGTPGPQSMTSTRTAPFRQVARAVIAVPDGVCRMAFSSRLVTTWSIWA